MLFQCGGKVGNIEILSERERAHAVQQVHALVVVHISG